MNAKYYLAALILSWGSLNADANAAANPSTDLPQLVVPLFKLVFPPSRAV